jgi:chemotaxis protein methyltransferase CheR
MSPRERELVARLCSAHAGIKVDPERGYLLESRLGPVARREGFGTIGELLQAVREREEVRLIEAIVEAMACADTCFFRDPTVFHHLFAQVLPALAAKRREEGREGRPIRIWSAGCASGQEVYSLAMMLDHAPAGAQIELYASDLSERVIEKAQSGLYSQFEVQRGLPARLLVRHFEKRDEMFVISPRLRQQVRWRRVNLIEDTAGQGAFDVVLCRNVLTGLTEAGRDRVLQNLGAAVATDGCLILGLHESAPSLKLVGPAAYAPEAIRNAA